MLHYTGREASYLLERTLERLYLPSGITRSEWGSRYDKFRSAIASWSSENIKIQMQEPHLILWDTHREFEGKTFVKTEQAKIGRWLSKRITAAGIELTDAQIEEYVSIVKSEVAMENAEVKLVHGEAIRDAYHQDNHGDDAGDMDGSCMRYDFCQRFMDVYVENPNQVALAVIQDEDGYNIARALVWTDVEGDRWLDRIYANRKNNMIMRAWAEGEGLKFVYDGNYGGREGCVVALDKGDFTYFPYMDSLYLLMEMDGKRYLTSGFDRNHDLNKKGNRLGTLRATNGGPFNGLTYCHNCDNFVDSPDQRYCDHCLETMDVCYMCDGMCHTDNMYYLDTLDALVCSYCYHNRTRECACCDDRQVSSNLRFHHHYGNVCDACSSDMVQCDTCPQTRRADDLNEEGQCDNCETRIEVESRPEPEFKNRFYWPNDENVEPCFYVRHRLVPETSEYIPFPTREELVDMRISGFDWHSQPEATAAWRLALTHPSYSHERMI